MRRLLACTVIALFALGCRADEVHSAKLVLVEIDRELSIATPGGKQKIDYTGFSGFVCADLQDKDEPKHLPQLMVSRAYSYEGGVEAFLRASFVVDLIRLDGYPRCRALDIFEYCHAHDCKTITSERRCFDLPRVAVPLERDGKLVDRAELVKLALDTFHDYVLTGLAQTEVTRDALDEEVLYRVVGTAESCDELEAREDQSFDPAQLLGCSYSCPLVPSAARGEILLELDTLLATLCEPTVRSCAGALFSPAPSEEVVVEGLVGP